MNESQTGWYLVYTKPRQELDAKINLERQKFTTYLPLQKQPIRKYGVYQVVTKPLFPRYLFIYLSSGIDDWSKIHSTRGCVSLVQFGTCPARVPQLLIEYLKKEETDRISKQTITSIPNFKVGDRIRILDGILSDYEGIVQVKNSQQRISVLLIIAENHTRRIDLSANQIKMVN